MPSLRCHHCNRVLPKTSARIYANNAWLCEDCVYLLDHPNAARIEKAPRPNPLRPQVEELFDA
jgi:hypothetical protein